MKTEGFLEFCTVSNILTAVRILLVPIIILAFYIPFSHHFGVCAVIFLLASLTDWLDGFLARYFKQTTQLGAFLDPVADKLVVATALVMLVGSYPFFWFAIPAIVIICREIVVSALREWMAQLGQHAVVKVSFVGKLKTLSQMLAILLLLFRPVDLHNSIVFVGFTLLYIAAILTVYSMWLYLRAAYHHFLSSKETQKSD